MLSLFLFSFAETHAQKKIRSVTIADKVIYATVDRPGELYLVSNTGRIRRFDSNGNLLSEYTNQSPPTLFDPRDGSRLFIYYHEGQRYAYLSPSFEITNSQTIDPSVAVDPWLMCVSGDHNLWILDAADLSLKRVNVLTSSLEVDYKIGDDLVKQPAEITYMREYQGFLFLLHRTKGILIFNKMGKRIKTIERPQLQYFNFLGEELYYPENNALKFLNLFTAETREIPLTNPGEFMLMTDERIYTVEGSSVGFFSLNP